MNVWLLFSSVYCFTIVECVFGLDELVPLYTVDNRLAIDCGNHSDKMMRIVFRGNAHSVYANQDPDGCTAFEVESAHFEFNDTMTNGCPFVKYPGIEVYYIEIVIQTGAIRKQYDQVYHVTCNYEIGGTKISNAASSVEGVVLKKSEWETVGDRFSSGRVTLVLYNARGAAITRATLGSYVQLRAFFSPGPSELGFKVWNCRAYTESGEYYIVIGGCGDGDIIASNRGFMSSSFIVADITRLARSIYFKSFMMPGSSTIRFQCDYIVCADTKCDGPSCAYATGRRKRYSRNNTSRHDGRGIGASGLPIVETEPITILPTEKVYKENLSEEAGEDGLNATDPETTKSRKITSEIDDFDAKSISLLSAMCALMLMFLAVIMIRFLCFRRSNRENS